MQLAKTLLSSLQHQKKRRKIDSDDKDENGAGHDGTLKDGSLPVLEMRVTHSTHGPGTLLGWRQEAGDRDRIGSTAGLKQPGCARVHFDGPKGKYNLMMKELESLRDEAVAAAPPSPRVDDGFEPAQGEMVAVLSMDCVAGKVMRLPADGDETYAVRIGSGEIVQLGRLDLRPLVRFEPSANWQEVPTGAALPAGLDIKVDLKTGRRVARLPGTKEATSTALIVRS